MNIPYVIDNQDHKLADVLNSLLAEHKGRSLDIVSAYFTVGGFGLLQQGLQALGNFRLLLGAEPASGQDIGLKPKADVVRGLLTQDMERLAFSEETLRLVEDLIAFLRREHVAVRLYDRGFLHAKCYLFYDDKSEKGWERLLPVAGIVGSSNFTAPGLISNRELNLSHKTVLSDEEAREDTGEGEHNTTSSARADRSRFFVSTEDVQGRILEERRRIKSTVGARAIIDLDAWFERQWGDSRDFKQDLIDLLDASKFGRKEYTPYQVYMKALYEYFKDELGDTPSFPIRSAVELAEFQEDAVKKARKVLARYDGVIIADSVGLGKTWIGKKLLEDFA